MHRGYRFDVRARCCGPATTRCGSASTRRTAYAEAVRAALGDRPNAYAEPFNFIRKMACNFGWDWGPTLVTAGIWQPIGLQTWSAARLAEVRPLVTVDGRRSGRVDGARRRRAGRRRAADRDRVGRGRRRRGADRRPARPRAVVTLAVPRRRRCGGRAGYGDQPRYDLAVTLAAADGADARPLGAARSASARSARHRRRTRRHAVHRRRQRRAGLRPRRQLDPRRRVPHPGHPGAATPSGFGQAVRRQRQPAAGLGRRPVRVARTSTTSPTSSGCMVGQDFLFACAAYPEEEPFAAEVAAEAREQVVRLAATRAWSGGPATTRTSGAAHDWGWQERLGGRTWGAGYYFDVLPRDRRRAGPDPAVLAGQPVLRRRRPAPQRPGARHACTSGTCGTPTTTRSYRDYRPRFVAEFGFQAPAGVRHAAPGDLRRAAGARLARHARTTRRRPTATRKLRRGLDAPPAGAARLRRLALPHPAQPGPRDRARHRALPVAAAAAAWARSCGSSTTAGRSPRGRRSTATAAASRSGTRCAGSYADRLLTIQPRDGGLALVAVNDGAPSRGRPRSTVTRLRSRRRAARPRRRGRARRAAALGG